MKHSDRRLATATSRLDGGIIDDCFVAQPEIGVER